MQNEILCEIENSMIMGKAAGVLDPITEESQKKTEEKSGIFFKT